jgi:hypothetical protein
MFEFISSVARSVDEFRKEMKLALKTKLDIVNTLEESAPFET